MMHFQLKIHSALFFQRHDDFAEVNICKCMHVGSTYLRSIKRPTDCVTGYHKMVSYKSCCSEHSACYPLKKELSYDKSQVILM